MITLSGISVRIKRRLIFEGIDWLMKKGQSWLFYGGNGSGKTLLARVIMKQQEICRGKIHYHNNTMKPDHITYVSFEEIKRVYDKDKKQDNSEYLAEAFDPGTLVRDFILNGEHESNIFQDIVSLLNIHHILDQGIRFLSSGETRKTLIAQALFVKPPLIILDNPFEGLDLESRNQMGDLLSRLYQRKQSLIIMVNNRADLSLLNHYSHLLVLDRCSLIASGKRHDVMKTDFFKDTVMQKRNRPIRGKDLELIRNRKNPNETNPVFSLRNVTVNYGERVVLKNVSWCVKTGEHWLVSGPNGAGKTTLLNMISGENSKAYGKDVFLFGRKRGSGESVWEIKEKFGIVNSGMHLTHMGRISLIHVVESGFFDSIGLYRSCTDHQKKMAEAWLEILGLAHLKNHLFRDISFGEQRLVLMGRAMIKNPHVLILDEPCAGLDHENRRLVLEMTDLIAEISHTQIIYVSHEPGEFPGCITHVLRFKSSGNQHYQVVCEKRL